RQPAVSGAMPVRRAGRGRAGRDGAPEQRHHRPDNALMAADPLVDASIAVFGGGAGWGKRVQESLQHRARAVRVIERDTPCEEVHAAVDASAVIFIAIPDDRIDALLRSLDGRLAGRIVIDCASNKSGFAQTLRNAAAAGASVCSTHPMVVSTTSPR